MKVTIAPKLGRHDCKPIVFLNPLISFDSEYLSIQPFNFYSHEQYKEKFY